MNDNNVKVVASTAEFLGMRIDYADDAELLMSACPRFNYHCLNLVVREVLKRMDMRKRRGKLGRVCKEEVFHKLS
ncbi:MAG: hypothetical protein ACPLTR_00990 [Thermacetogeniaceae bacterium]